MADGVEVHVEVIRVGYFVQDWRAVTDAAGRIGADLLQEYLTQLPVYRGVVVELEGGRGGEAFREDWRLCPGFRDRVAFC